jgi:peptidoglycan/LPS O-acetylase OafA/YrhL
MQFGLRLGPDLAGKTTLVGLLAVALVGAVVLYHVVEEPARRWMRSMMKPPHDSRADRGHGRLQPIDGQHDERSRVVSVRAG